jgi:hypothetical protein
VKNSKKWEGYFRWIEKELEIVADPRIHAKWCQLALKCDVANAKGLLKMAEFWKAVTGMGWLWQGTWGRCAKNQDRTEGILKRRRRSGD